MPKGVFDIVDAGRPCAKHALLTCLSLVGLGIAVAATGLRDKLTSGFAELDQADPIFLGAAALAFAIGLTCCGLAWRAGLQRAGAPTSPADAVARYVTGSLVSSLVPLRAGGAVRLALYHRVARSVRTVAEVATAVGSVRAGSLALLVCAASRTAPVPIWPCLLLAAAAIGAAVVAALLGRSATALRATAGWVCGATLARVAAATFVALAFDAPSPVLAGVAVVAAIELASTLPLTPGNLGLSSAAVAFVLAAQGLPADVALAAGLALAMVETATSLALGLCGLAYLTGIFERIRRAVSGRRVPVPSGVPEVAPVQT